MTPRAEVGAGKRPGEPGDFIGDKPRGMQHEPGLIAVGIDIDIDMDIDNEARALRCKARDHALENGPGADTDERLVAATHSPREPAGQHGPETRGPSPVEPGSPLAVIKVGPLPR